MTLAASETILDGKYHILRLIGEGGMARVWLAEEPRFDLRQVALKEPRTDLPADQAQEVRSRYEREVQVCAALEKAQVPRIVRAITTELHDGALLLVMAYMPGGDLASLLRQHPDGLPIDRAVGIAQDILVALAGIHAHALEIVHRDVKPSNVLFDEQGTAHLADFGLAQLAGTSGRSQLQGGGHPGTLMYMAFEQEASPHSLTPAADLYALGCVLFEMLTGKRYKRVRPGTAPTSLRPEVPGWLDEVLARVLDADPWDRWPDASEMATALRNPAVLARAQAAEEAARKKAEERARVQAAEEARQRAKERARRRAAAREQAETAYASGRWAEAQQAARDWLELDSESERAAAVLAEAKTMEQAAALQRTATGLVVATPQNITWLLSQPEPPKRIWWEKAAMELCLVPAGEFLMGSPENMGQPDEHPQHPVYLDAYYLGRYPVTQAQYYRFVLETGHRIPQREEDWSRPYDWDPEQKTPPQGKGNHPVVLIGWDDAVAYCQWAGLRLPTEAEWEKAASWDPAARLKRIYPWGDKWYSDKCNTWEGGKGGTTAVGAYSPAGDSSYGCADMSGNVWDWVADWYAKDYYSGSPERNALGPSTGIVRVLRGGSWYISANAARSAYRLRNYPHDRFSDNGFRCGVSSTASP